jgi:hypothetical protein
MKWGEAAMDGGADSRLAADRFVTGALRRIRIRTEIEKLRWREVRSASGRSRNGGEVFDSGMNAPRPFMPLAR